MEPRAAVGEYESRHGYAHALHDEPEPACGAARSLGVRRAPARAQVPGHRAGRRRRLRLEDLHLRRGDGVRLGGEEDRPPGQMDRGAHGILPVGRARPRSRHARRARARRARQDHGPARAHDRQYRRLHVDLRVVRPHLCLCSAAVGPVRHSEHLLRSRRGLHQHRAGRRLSRRRPAGSGLRGRAHCRGCRARDRTRSGANSAA